MSYKVLYLNWDFNGIKWNPKHIRIHVPDIDDSVKIYLEKHVERQYEIAQLHTDYLKMYVNHTKQAFLPAPCVMTATDGGVITTYFSFTDPY